MNGLTKETFDAMVKVAQDAQSPKALAVDHPRKAYFQRGDQTEVIDLPPPLRQSKVRNLEGIIDAAQGDAAKKPVVWHDDDGVRLVLDDADRRDVVTLPLTHARPFAILVELESAVKPMDQRRFVRLLRFELGVAAVTVAPWRKLEWSQQKAAQGEIAPGRDRLGSDIQGSVKGASDLPEELLIPVPLYDQLGERSSYPVRCAIDLDVYNEQIVLMPLPGEIQAVIDEHQASIHERLVAALDGVPVYYGSP